MRVFMFVGANDSQWRERSDRVVDELKLSGVDVYYEVVPNSGHVIKALEGPNAAILFDFLAMAEAE